MSLTTVHQSSTDPSSLTRGGQLNSAGDARALYLKLFSGEMFKGFQNNTIARDLVTKRTLKNGKSMQFVYTGRTTSEFHTPGNSILGNSDGAPPVAEKTITCDQLLVSSAFVYELDDSFSLRPACEISRMIGYALAERYGRFIFRAIAKGARRASPSARLTLLSPVVLRSVLVLLPTTLMLTALPIWLTPSTCSCTGREGCGGDGRVAVLNPSVLCVD